MQTELPVLDQKFKELSIALPALIYDVDHQSQIIECVAIFQEINQEVLRAFPDKSLQWFQGVQPIMEIVQIALQNQDWVLLNDVLLTDLHRLLEAVTHG